MKEIECPECGEMIPDDSKFCDLCGAELLECINCRTPGTDAFCPECGKPMIARKVEIISGDDIGSAGGEKMIGSDAVEKTIGRVRKAVILRQRDSGMTITPLHDAVIGRTDSPYISELSRLTMVSRRHGKFVYRGGEWYIVDFGSTNGTYVNDREVPVDTPVKFNVGDVIDIGTYLFDVVEK